MTSFEVGTRKMLCAAFRMTAPVSVTEIATSPHVQKKLGVERARSDLGACNRFAYIPGHCRHPIDESDSAVQHGGQTASCSFGDRMATRSLRTPFGVMR